MSIKKINFCPEENELLLNLVENFKSTIENKKTNAVFNRKKNEAWALLAEEFNRRRFAEDKNAVERTLTQLQNRYKTMKTTAQKNSAADKVILFKGTGGGSCDLVSSAIDERITAMGVVVSPHDSIYDSDYVFEQRVQKQGYVELPAEEIPDEEIRVPSTLTEVDNLCDISLVNRAANALCEATYASTPVQPKLNSLKKRGVKRMANASAKTAEALEESVTARKIAMGNESNQRMKHEKEMHENLMRIKNEEHDLKMQVLKAKLAYYESLTQGK